MLDRALVAVALIIVLPAAGCASTKSPGRSNTVAAAAVAGRPSVDLEREYLIGPEAARQLGLRIDFQTQTHPDDDSGIKQISVQGDAVFVLDGANFLTRLRRDNGQRLWRLPVADRLDDVQGITYQPAAERVFLTVSSHLLVLDDDTGSMIDKQDLGQIASTAPVVFGPFFIYGSRNGQIVWHSFEVGYQWRGYRVSPTIRLAPLLVDGMIVATGSDGRVMVLDASSAASIWSKRLLNAIEAPPTTGGGVLYIAGLDQYVWAIDVANGRTLWKFLTESPLKDPPVLIGAQLYQQIPGKGLHCFAAQPVDTPGGEILWTQPAVRGNVVGSLGHRVFVWDAGDRQLTVVDADRGGVMHAVSLPSVRYLRMSRRQGGEVFVAGDAGRVSRLVPRK